MLYSFRINPKDDVVTVTEAVLEGEDITYITEGREITMKAAESIPMYHKIAVKNVKKGCNVLKYGEVIGYATCDIKAGDHVHTHNLSDISARGKD